MISEKSYEILLSTTLRQADTAKTAIKDGDKDAAKRDSWLDLEKECNEAESELDDTVERLPDQR